MLANQTIDKLVALGMVAMAAGLADQLCAPGTYDELSFADRLGLLVDKEADARDSRRLAARLKTAKLRHPSGPPGAWTALSPWPWPREHGCASTTTCSSPGRLGWARALWLAHSQMPPSARGILHFMSAHQGYWTTWPSAGPMAATPAPSPNWRASTCWC
jgi:hypothetical protein